MKRLRCVLFYGMTHWPCTHTRAINSDQVQMLVKHSKPQTWPARAHSLMMTEHRPNCMTSGSLERPPPINPNLTSQDELLFPLQRAPTFDCLMYEIQGNIIIFAMGSWRKVPRALVMLKEQRISGQVWWPARTGNWRDGTFRPIYRESDFTLCIGGWRWRLVKIIITKIITIIIITIIITAITISSIFSCIKQWVSRLVNTWRHREMMYIGLQLPLP